MCIIPFAISHWPLHKYSHNFTSPNSTSPPPTISPPILSPDSRDVLPLRLSEQYWALDRYPYMAYIRPSPFLGLLECFHPTNVKVSDELQLPRYQIKQWDTLESKMATVVDGLLSFFKHSNPTFPRELWAIPSSPSSQGYQRKHSSMVDFKTSLEHSIEAFIVNEAYMCFLIDLCILYPPTSSPRCTVARLFHRVNVAMDKDFMEGLNESIFGRGGPGRNRMGTIIDMTKECPWLSLAPYMVLANIPIWIFWDKTKRSWYKDQWTVLFAPDQASRSGIPPPPMHLPPVEEGSGQTPGESIADFFNRRQIKQKSLLETDASLRSISENRKKSHASKQPPSKHSHCRAFYWKKTTVPGLRMRTLISKGVAQQIWSGNRKVYNAVNDEWDICSDWGDFSPEGSAGDDESSESDNDDHDIDMGGAPIDSSSSSSLLPAPLLMSAPRATVPHSPSALPSAPALPNALTPSLAPELHNMHSSLPSALPDKPPLLPSALPHMLAPLPLCPSLMLGLLSRPQIISSHGTPETEIQQTVVTAVSPTLHLAPNSPSADVYPFLDYPPLSPIGPQIFPLPDDDWRSNSPSVLSTPSLATPLFPTSSSLHSTTSPQILPTSDLCSPCRPPRQLSPESCRPKPLHDDEAAKMSIGSDDLLVATLPSAVPNQGTTSDLPPSLDKGKSKAKKNTKKSTDSDRSCQESFEEIFYFKYGFLIPNPTVILRDSFEHCGTFHTWKALCKASVGFEMDPKENGTLTGHYNRFLTKLIEKKSDDTDLSKHHPLSLKKMSSELRIQVRRYFAGSIYLLCSTESDPPFYVAVSASVALECIRRRLGPHAEGVIRYLVSRGIPFRTLHSPNMEMLLQRPDQPSLPSKTRHQKYTTGDFALYEKCRDDFLLRHGPARRALGYGGIIGRLTVDVLGMDAACASPSPSALQGNGYKVLFDNGQVLVDDDLSANDLDFIVGAYITPIQKNQVANVSWYPRHHIWEGSGMNVGSWTPLCEQWFQNHTADIRSGHFQPLSTRDWRDKLRGAREAIRIRESMENEASKFIQSVDGASLRV